MKVLSIPGLSNCCIVGVWTCFQCLEVVSPLIQEVSSVLTNWRGVSRLLTSEWECPYRVVKDICLVKET